MILSASDLRSLQDFFVAKPVKKAFLFGSYLRDEATSDSDVDILVELDYSEHVGLGFVKMKNDLEGLLHKKVDLLTDQSLSELIRPFVEKEKKLIYERSAGR